MFKPINQDISDQLVEIARSILPGTDLAWSAVSVLAGAEKRLQLYRPIGALEKSSLRNEYKLAKSALALALQNARCAGFGDRLSALIDTALGAVHVIPGTENPTECAIISTAALETIKGTIHSIESRQPFHHINQRSVLAELIESFDWLEQATAEVDKAAYNLAPSQFFSTLSLLPRRYSVVFEVMDEHYVLNHFARANCKEPHRKAVGSARMLIACNSPDSENLPRLASECGVRCTMSYYMKPLALVLFQKPDISDNDDHYWFTSW